MPNRYISPSKKMSFFGNYNAHAEAIIHKQKNSFQIDGIFAKLEDCSSYEELILKLINEQLDSKLNFNVPLYDKYDYMDEVVGATAIPIVGLVASLYCIGMTAKELFYLTITKFGNSIQDENKEESNHTARALLYLLGTIASALVAILSLIKCGVSMLTRPIATLFKGFNASSEKRFGIPPEGYDSSADNSDFEPDTEITNHNNFGQ